MPLMHWLKLQHSDWRANLVKDFFVKINFPPMRALEFITGHVTYNPAYTYKFQLKTSGCVISLKLQNLITFDKIAIEELHQQLLTFTRPEGKIKVI